MTRYARCGNCGSKPTFTFPTNNENISPPCRCEKQAYEKWCWDNGKLDWQDEDVFNKYWQEKSLEVLQKRKENYRY